MSPERARTKPGTNAGSFAPHPRGEADDVRLDEVPSDVRYDSLEEIADAGYVTDEWRRWQQGQCAAYAVALVDAHPDLRFAVIGQTENGDGDATGGWRERHAFAHDDHYAYDSAGRHPLPYLGIEARCDLLELDSDPEDYGYRDEFDDETFAAALAHANRHQILTRTPIPFGGHR